MTHYQRIDPNQEPVDLGLDPLGRQMIGFNIAAVKESSDTFRQEITNQLVASGVGTFVGSSIDIFRGAVAKIPTSGGPYLHLRDTGGAEPMHSHNEINPPAVQRPSMQITAYGVTYTAADVMIRAAYTALVGVRNTDLAP